MNDFPMRKPNRLQGYDYFLEGCYFVTVCTKSRKPILGDIVNGQVVLSGYGRIVEEEISKTAVLRKNVRIDKFVVMPNHVHFILAIVENIYNKQGSRDSCETGVCNTPLRLVPAESLPCSNSIQSPSHSVGAVVRGIKSAVSKRIGTSVWQRNYHDHVIRDEEVHKRLYEYVDANPSLWGEDCHNPGSAKYMDWHGR